MAWFHNDVLKAKKPISPKPAARIPLVVHPNYQT